MATDKRERQRAARQARFEAETTEERKSRRTRTGLRVAAIVGAALVAAFAYSMIAGGSSDDDEPDVETEGPDEAEAPAEDADEDLDDEDSAVDGPVVIESVSIREDADAAPSDELSDDLPGRELEGRETDEECPPADGTADREIAFDEPPPWCIDVSAGYVAEVETSAGSFEITLDTMEAPVTVNNFVFLARSHFYDTSTFHRAIRDFMVQGGDPVGTPPGGGNPGYALGDDPDFTGELPQEEPYYPLMSVAMANSGADPATAGSQFFVVSGPQGEALPNDYTRFGQVTDGEDVIRAIEGTMDHPDVAAQ